MTGYGAAGCTVASGCSLVTSASLVTTGVNAMAMGLLGASLVLLGLLLVRFAAVRRRPAETAMAV